MYAESQCSGPILGLLGQKIIAETRGNRVTASVSGCGLGSQLAPSQPCLPLNPAIPVTVEVTRTFIFGIAFVPGNPDLQRTARTVQAGVLPVCDLRLEVGVAAAALHHRLHHAAVCAASGRDRHRLRPYFHHHQQKIKRTFSCLRISGAGILASLATLDVHLALCLHFARAFRLGSAETPAE
ncbi:hypothetical protein RRG08_051333 [Elysia crispata]|uniref:Uncharacterized protein n=1 Tax=Elysia crispata TaxID=231223 RepID=A0AAE1EA28_9GAST|nr:hypothetical protein RRG08_051333 [Elysia crispata]